MRNGLAQRAAIAAAGVALGLAEPTTARAQFMAPGGFPLIAVPPPPAQSIVIPRKPKPAPAPATQTAPDPSAQPEITCRYQGQTRVCQ